MALLSELVEICDQQYVDSAATLSVFARRLREAGRVSKAGRGRGAAHMTFLDGARFLIACAATDKPERAADAEYVFSGLKLSNESSVTSDGLAEWEGTASLDEALALTLARLADGTIERLANEKWKPNKITAAPQHIWLTVRRGGVGATLQVLDGRFFFYHPALMELMAVGEVGGYPAQKVINGAYEREVHRFRTGKNITVELDKNLLQGVANLISGKD